MRPTRRSQPYRKGRARQSSGALAAMLRGRGVTANPMDPERELEKRAKKHKRRNGRRGTLAKKMRGR